MIMKIKADLYGYLNFDEIAGFDLSACSGFWSGDSCGENA